MSVRVSKSRLFAVVLTRGGNLEVHYLWRRTENVGTGQQEKHLIHRHVATPWKVGDKDHLIKLLTEAGTSVRYFDPDESKWMEASDQVGLMSVAGPRDGQWGPPNLEQFEQEYLLT